MRRKKRGMRRLARSAGGRIQGLPGIGVQININSRVCNDDYFGGGAGKSDGEVQQLLRTIKAGIELTTAATKLEPLPHFLAMHADFRSGRVTVDGESMSLQEATDRGYMAGGYGKKITNIF